MKTTHPTTINPYFVLLLFTLGACSVKSSAKGKFEPIPTSVKYRFECQSDQGKVGIRDLGGIFNVYQNDEVLFKNHDGGDLSIFLTSQEPQPGKPDFVGFAIESQTESDLQYYALNLSLNTESGMMKVQEEKYVRATPNDFWELSSSKSLLEANSCKKL